MDNVEILIPLFVLWNIMFYLIIKRMDGLRDAYLSLFEVGNNVKSKTRKQSTRARSRNTKAGTRPKSPRTGSKTRKPRVRSK